MIPKRLYRGFSLVEVFLALGIFAVGILALAALMGSLFERSTTERTSSNAAHVMALVNQWLYAEAHQDFGRLQNVFLAGDAVVVWLYAWDAGGVDPEWKVMERAELTADYARYQQGLGGFASAIYRVECVRHLSGLPSGAQSEQFSPLRISVCVLPAPDPADPFSAAGAAGSAPLLPGLVFFSVFRP